MCELFALTSNYPATMTMSLAKFAPHAGFNGVHKDGWGVGYYKGKEVMLIKEATSAVDSEWVKFILAHQIESSIILSQIRKATQGDPSYSNTQPFVKELLGRQHIFIHNGDLRHLEEESQVASDPLFTPIGSTDSEKAFCLLMARMTNLWKSPTKQPTLQQRTGVVAEFARYISRFGPANFIYSDGEALFAYSDRRFQAKSGRVEPPGLHLLQRHCPTRFKSFASGDIGLPRSDQYVALLATVPLTDEAWEPLEQGELVVLVDGEIVFRNVHSSERPDLAPADTTHIDTAPVATAPLDAAPLKNLTTTYSF